MKKRTRSIIILAVIVLLIAAGMFYFLWKMPPRAARLLPEADGIFFLNLKPVRSFSHKQLPVVPHDADYQQFIDATGIDWERDIDQVAIAVHGMSNPDGPNGAAAYSMVFTGRLDAQKLRTWLDAHAASREEYAGQVIDSIPSEGRTVRVAVLSSSMVVVSNAPTTEQIHSMIDRRLTSYMPFSGSLLLSSYYGEVPALAPAWGIGQIGLPFSSEKNIQAFGLTLPLQNRSILIASATPSTFSTKSVLLRVDAVMESEDVAARKAAAVATLVTLARGFTHSSSNGLQQLLSTAAVTQKGNRVRIETTIDPALWGGFLQEQLQPSEDVAPKNMPSTAPDTSK